MHVVRYPDPDPTSRALLPGCRCAASVSRACACMWGALIVTLLPIGWGLSLYASRVWQKSLRSTASIAL